MTTTANLTAITEFLTAGLEPERIKDFCENGLQIRGREEVSNVVFALDPTLEMFEASAEGTLFVLHHSLIWGKIGRIDEMLAERLKVLFRKEQSLFAGHLPLDAHDEYGTGITVARMLGLEDIRPFAFENGAYLGRSGRLPEPLPPAEFLKLVRTKLHSPHADMITHSDAPIATVGVVTGGGASMFPMAVEAGLDAFLTGEPRYATTFEVRERGVNFCFAGHYATEIWGVKSWMEAFQAAFPTVPCTLWEKPERL